MADDPAESPPAAEEPATEAPAEGESPAAAETPPASAGPEAATPPQLKAEPRASPGATISQTSSGEDLPPDESNKIIAMTLGLLYITQKKVDDQKIDSHSLSFMLLRIKESLDAYYNDYIPMLNTFLYHADKVTSDYFAYMCCALPQYGDFTIAIKESEDDKLDVGFPTDVPKEQLLSLVQGVLDNYHAAAMFVKAGRANYRDINLSIPERKDMVVKVVKNIPDWLKLQDNVTKGLEDIRDQTFKISAYVDFLKQGESKMAPTLDLTPLSRVSGPETNQSTN